MLTAGQHGSADNSAPVQTILQFSCSVDHSTPVQIILDPCRKLRANADQCGPVQTDAWAGMGQQTIADSHARCIAPPALRVRSNRLSQVLGMFWRSLESGGTERPVNMAHIRQSKPDSGLRFQVKELETF